MAETTYQQQLEFIDDLQNLGLDRVGIELPQLVVVGDQNTGKSSVLQAITQLPFPVNESMCTRFPTEVVFKRTKPGSETVVNASIRPGRDCQGDPEHHERLRDFKRSYSELTSEIMEEIVHEATQCIFNLDTLPDDKSMSEVGLSYSTLRIERSGPNEKHWSIVDLPGLIQGTRYVNVQRKGSSPPPHKGRGSSNAYLAQPITPSRTPSPSGRPNDVAIAEELVTSYLVNERSIVLAVIDPTDYQRHRIFSLIQPIQNLDKRMIGIITKCDLKQEGSDSWMINLLRNEKHSFCPLKHGWFALRNRKPKEISITNEERNKLEAEEFERAEWSDVDPKKKGITALMRYVDKTRNDQLQESMPDIINEIRTKLSTSTRDLQILGDVRDDPRSQRFYLWQLSNKLSQMVDAALNDRREGLLVNSDAARLRFQVQERLVKFAKDMSDPSVLPYPFRDSGDDMNELITTIDQEDWKERIDSGPPIYSWINKHIHASRGTGLEGDVNPSIRQYLFRQQCVRWEEIATQLVENIRSVVTHCYKILFEAAATSDSRIQSRIDVHLAQTTADWESETNSALKCLIDDNRGKLLFTLNPEYTLGAQKRLQQRLQKVEENLTKGTFVQAQLRRLSSPPPPTPNPVPQAMVQFHLTPPIQTDGSFLSKNTDLDKIFNVHDTLESYYFIALWRFVDNVAMQVVERHLLGPKSPVRAFSIDMVGGLADEELDLLAGEDGETKRRRIELRDNKAKLEKALERWKMIRLTA
ncbi:MAG: hypothetical protein MMC33_004825 [Icmadophila ericetorum]|nr:hypothetical protein [Icmadophila ericetorum]